MALNFGNPVDNELNEGKVEETVPQNPEVENVCAEAADDAASVEVTSSDAPEEGKAECKTDAPCGEEESPCVETSAQCDSSHAFAAMAEIAELKTMIQGLCTKLEDIETRLVAKIEEDNQKNALFDRMYDELAQHKKGLYASIMKPFINETVSLTGDYERLVGQMDTMDHDKLVRYVKNIPGDLEDMLENNGVERYEDDTEKFNPKTQRVMKTVETDDPEKDNVIAEHIRKGYRWDGQMLKPEMVAIYKYKKPEEQG